MRIGKLSNGTIFSDPEWFQGHAIIWRWIRYEILRVLRYFNNRQTAPPTIGLRAYINGACSNLVAYRIIRACLQPRSQRGMGVGARAPPPPKVWAPSHRSPCYQVFLWHLIRRSQWHCTAQSALIPCFVGTVTPTVVSLVIAIHT